jgi:hypothetical protein
LFKVIGNCLAIIQGAQARLLDGGDVDENIRAAILGLDKAETLSWIEPFDCASGHKRCSEVSAKMAREAGGAKGAH